MIQIIVLLVLGLGIQILKYPTEQISYLLLLIFVDPRVYFVGCKNGFHSGPGATNTDLSDFIAIPYEEGNYLAEVTFVLDVIDLQNHSQDTAQSFVEDFALFGQFHSDESVDVLGHNIVNNGDLWGQKNFTYNNLGVYEKGLDPNNGNIIYEKEENWSGDLLVGSSNLYTRSQASYAKFPGWKAPVNSIFNEYPYESSNTGTARVWYDGSKTSYSVTFRKIISVRERQKVHLALALVRTSNGIDGKRWYQWWNSRQNGDVYWQTDSTQQPNAGTNGWPVLNIGQVGAVLPEPLRFKYIINHKKTTN